MTIVVVTGAKGGLGVTTIAANLAAMLSEGRQVHLLAMDTGSDWSLHLRRLVAASGQKQPLDWSQPNLPDSIWCARLGQRGGLNVLALDGGADRWSNPRRRVQEIAQDFVESGLLIIDAPPISFAEARAFAARGLVLNVASADAIAFSAALRWREGVTDNSGAWNVHHVLNMIDPRRPLCRDIEAIALDTLGKDLVARMRFDAAIPNAAADGGLIADHAPGSQGMADLSALAEAIDARTAEAAEPTLRIA